MSQSSRQDPLPGPRTSRAAALLVHIFTATGAGIALLAMLEAVREHWTAMFAWLGLALLIDGLDGPIARRLNVEAAQPNWSGEILDLVVDFLTYVFVPAYAITASGLLLPIIAPLLGMGIVISGALYFSDRRMKTEDNHFRGFPALWNAAAFYLFLLRPSSAVSGFAIAALIVLTFVPFKVLHPVRVKRFRVFNLLLIAVWAALAMIAIANDFDVAMPITAVLCAIALYIICGDAVIRFLRPENQ